MTAKEAMNIGMEIAEAHTKTTLDIFRVKPDATIEEALRGTQVWLGSKIMMALCKVAPNESP
jgi:hypothetical protein